MELKQKKAKGQEKAKSAEGRDEKTGRFITGNRFWEVRSSAGPNPKFATPEELWAAACEYFQWVEENPMWEDKLVTFQGAATHEPVAKMRAMTLAGLSIFLDIDISTWGEWRKSRPDLSSVITRIERIVYSQKFSGAASDLLNANIIARDLGLADKNELSGKDGGPIETTNVSTRELATSVMDLLREAKLEKGENA